MVTVLILLMCVFFVTKLYDAFVICLVDFFTLQPEVNWCCVTQQGKHMLQV